MCGRYVADTWQLRAHGHALRMGSRERAVDVGAARARSLRARLTAEAREARLQVGLSQGTVAASLGISRSQYSRIERDLSPDLSIDMAARLFAVLGMQLAAQAYPAGDPVRDAAQVALLERLHGRCHRSFRWQTEVAFPIPGDLRAWDATATSPIVRIGIEGETRLRDVQAIDRKLGLRERDGGMDRVILLVSDTRANREAIRAYGDILQARLPILGRRALELLGAGVDPGGNALIVL
jgi:transcriptional regulator with XRE-family HTH domain